MTDEAATAERIRTNLRDGVHTAVRITTVGVPRREVLRSSTDQLINLACAVAHLDMAAACAAELLATIEKLDLTDRASLARHTLAGLLEQAGYVQFVERKEPADGEV